MNRSVTVYIEGGGDSSDARAQLRAGFDALFRPQKERAAQNRVSLKFVCCGPRNEAHATFVNFRRRTPSDVAGLLVDSESPIDTQKDVTTHLAKRDGWSFDDAQKLNVRLMVEAMEAWILADLNAVQEWFKAEITLAAKKTDLIEKAKLVEHLDAAAGAADKAAKRPKKRRYGKLTDAPALLKRLNPETVAAHSNSFADFRTWLEEQIA